MAENLKKVENEVAVLDKITETAAAATASLAAARRPLQSKIPSLSETFSHDSSAGELRIRFRKYKAYYHASIMQLSRNQDQQAYLLNCLDSELYLRLTSSIAATTPVLGAGNSCLNMNIFKQNYPLLLWRKTFFQLQQQTGQDKRAFVKHLKAAGAEADIQGMNLEDALCLVIISGLKDSRLREKLSELENYPGFFSAH